MLSVGGIRQQFGIEENIKMSLFGAEFLRDIHRNLSVYGKHPVQVNFNPQVLFTRTLACLRLLYSSIDKIEAPLNPLWPPFLQA